jgi:hypothetical protein
MAALVHKQLIPHHRLLIWIEVALGDFIGKGINGEQLTPCSRILKSCAAGSLKSFVALRA